MKKKEILVVEDNIVIALDIKKIVKELGCTVSITSSFDETISYLERITPDLIIMDIIIKGSKDGIETSSYIKDIYNIPIVFLTSYVYDDLLQRALDIKPEFYLSKPYRKEGLKSSILFILHKIEKKICENRTLIAEDYYFDKSTYDLYKGSNLIKLGEKEKKLLQILFKERGKTLKFNELESAIWLKEVPSNSSLRTLVYRLRNKIDNKFIESIPYYGFRLKV